MISEIPRSKLCEIIRRFGKETAEDPRKCEGLLRDFCGGYKREIHALVNALREKTAEELIAASDGLPHEVLVARLAQRLEDIRGLDRELAQWAVISWGIALGRFAAREFDTDDGAVQQKGFDHEMIEAQRRNAALDQLEMDRRRQAEDSKRNEELRRQLDDDSKKDLPRPSTNWKILSAVGAGLAVLIWFLFTPKAIEVKSVKFFKADDGLAGQINAPTIFGSRSYRSEFQSNEPRFVWYDLQLASPAAKDFTIDVLWRYPDGATFTQNIGIKAGSHGYTLGRGFLQGAPNWKVGSYVVEFSSSGQKIATGEFKISPSAYRSPSPTPIPRPVPPSPVPPSPQAVYDIPSLQANIVGGLRFFDGPRQVPQPESRQYQTRFDARTARYIRVEINLKNAGFEPGRSFRIEDVWLRDGREFNRGNYERTTPPAQQERLYSSYFGADNPGTWQRGNYAVHVYIGSQLVRSGRFVVE